MPQRYSMDWQIICRDSGVGTQTRYMDGIGHLVSFAATNANTVWGLIMLIMIRIILIQFSEMYVDPLELYVEHKSTASRG